MTQDYIIRKNFEILWLQGHALSDKLLRETRDALGISYLPVHGDPFLSRVDDYDLLCYFIYTLSSWWEIPLIDRINSNRDDNNFAIIMDINPAPETYFRLGHLESPRPESRADTLISLCHIPNALCQICANRQSRRQDQLPLDIRRPSCILQRSPD